jgi:hypothetical protein
MIPVRSRRLVSPPRPAPKCLVHRPGLPLPPGPVLPYQSPNPACPGNRTALTHHQSPANQRNRAGPRHQENLPRQTDLKKLPNQARWPALTHSRHPRSSPGSTRSLARPGPIRPSPARPLHPNPTERSGRPRRNGRPRHRCGKGRPRGTRSWRRSGRPGRNGSDRKHLTRCRRAARRDSAGCRCPADQRFADRALGVRRGPGG